MPKPVRESRTTDDLSHLDARGRARMVDIADKPVTAREAVASAEVHMSPATLRLLMSGRAKKGDVLALARVAGIQAAKRTPELIPLCHAITLTGCEVTFEAKPRRSVLAIETRVRALDRTGAEMEALSAAAVAALTIYDMLKSVDRAMTISELSLREKRGGRSGHYVRNSRAARAGASSVAPGRVSAASRRAARPGAPASKAPAARPARSGR